MKTGTKISLVLLVVAILAIVTNATLDVSANNARTYLDPIRPYLFWIVWAVIIGVLILLTRRYMTRIDGMLDSGSPSGMQPSQDHWAERQRLEISVLANVSAGREATDFPIAKDPENARFRQLKDAVNTGELNAADLHGDRAGIMTAITIDEFRKFVKQSGRNYWVEVLERWDAKQPAVPHGQRDSVLSDPEPGLTMAAWWAVMESAWGRFKRDNPPDTSTDLNARIRSLMHMVASIVSEAAMVGSLTIKGRPPGEIEFEEIPKATWRLAAIVANPNVMSIWKLEVTARSSVDPDRIERVLSYDSLIVDFEEFQAVFDSMGPDPE